MLINFHNFLNTARFLYKARIGDINVETIGSGAKP
jgi:hypothetical protein